MEYIIELDSRNEEVIIGIDGDNRYSIPKNPANADYQAYLAYLADPMAQSKEITTPQGGNE